MCVDKYGTLIIIISPTVKEVNLSKQFQLLDYLGFLVFFTDEEETGGNRDVVL